MRKVLVKSYVNLTSTLHKICKIPCKCSYDILTENLTNFVKVLWQPDKHLPQKFVRHVMAWWVPYQICKVLWLA
jgi:quinolinate synthase